MPPKKPLSQLQAESRQRNTRSAKARRKQANRDRKQAQEEQARGASYHEQASTGGDSSLDSSSNDSDIDLLWNRMAGEGEQAAGAAVVEDPDLLDLLILAQPSVPASPVLAPKFPPKVGSIVFMVFDPITTIQAKVLAAPWGEHRQLDLEAQIPVEARTLLKGEGNEAMAAIGTRRGYKAIRPSEQEEAEALQRGEHVEARAVEVEVESGIQQQTVVRKFPRVRWLAKEKQARKTAGTWHHKE